MSLGGNTSCLKRFFTVVITRSYILPAGSVLPPKKSGKIVEEKTRNKKQETRKTGRYVREKCLKEEIKTKKRKKNRQKADYS